MQEKMTPIWNQLSSMIDDKQGTNQMEKGVNKGDNPPDPDYVHLHLEIFFQTSWITQVRVEASSQGLKVQIQTSMVNKVVKEKEIWEIIAQQKHLK